MRSVESVKKKKKARLSSRNTILQLMLTGVDCNVYSDNGHWRRVRQHHCLMLCETLLTFRALRQFSRPILSQSDIANIPCHQILLTCRVVRHCSHHVLSDIVPSHIESDIAHIPCPKILLTSHIESVRHCPYPVSSDIANMPCRQNGQRIISRVVRHCPIPYRVRRCSHPVSSQT